MANNINLDVETNDDYFFTCISDQVCSNEEDLTNWRQHSSNKILVINDLQQSGLYIDKVPQFPLDFLNYDQLLT